MAYRYYDEIAQLEAQEQRRVLQAGDAVERVWAAWALGMRLGGLVLPDLLSTLDESPDPGTRRHLLVVLAGLGETDVLRVLAADDPDQYVRATACQYLVRTGNVTDRGLSGFLRERALSDHSAVVKRDLLAELPEGFAVLSPVDFARLAGDDDFDLRSLAIERLVTGLPLDQLIPGPLEDRIEREQNRNLRRHLLETGIRIGVPHV